MTESHGQADIRITDEMIRRGCLEVHDIGGVHFNPHLGPEMHSDAVRRILEVALGLKQHKV